MAEDGVAIEYTFLSLYAVLSILNLYALYRSIKRKELFPCIILAACLTAILGKYYCTPNNQTLK
jgi:hypothetical protein